MPKKKKELEGDIERSQKFKCPFCQRKDVSFMFDVGFTLIYCISPNCITNWHDFAMGKTKHHDDPQYLLDIEYGHFNKAGENIPITQEVQKEIEPIPIEKSTRIMTTKVYSKSKLLKYNLKFEGSVEIFNLMIDLLGELERKAKELDQEERIGKKEVIPKKPSSHQFKLEDMVAKKGTSKEEEIE
jgi:hypothetical protein